ncbi:MAG: tryptophan-rich sensory protein [Bacillota bacterium]
MKNTVLKILAGVAYLAMIVINALANILPINNRTTGAVSNSYPNLFAPAALTFSIWGLIYLLLAGYVVYQFTKSAKGREGLFSKINPLFIATSLANFFWVLAWHYDYIGLSVILIVTLLVLLIKIANILRQEKFFSWEKLFIMTPFSVYFGWITVATIANITVFLVSIGWNGFGIADYIWTSIILLVGALIGILRMRKDKNIAYGLVLVWAYLGILLKHLSVGGFNGKYPSVITTIILCLIAFVFSIGKISFYSKK